MHNFHLEKYLRGMAKGLCTFEEFANTWLGFLLDVDVGDLPSVLATVPLDVLIRLHQFFDNLCRSNDFAPRCMIFFWGDSSPQNIAKHENIARPKCHKVLDALGAELKRREGEQVIVQ